MTNTDLAHIKEVLKLLKVAGLIDGNDKIAIHSGWDEQISAIHDAFGINPILLTMNEWDFNLSSGLKFDLLCAFNNFMYISNPKECFENVFKSCKYVLIQDTITRNRGVDVFAGDGDCMRYSYGDIVSNYPKSYDLSVYKDRMILFYPYTEADLHIHFIALLRGDLKMKLLCYFSPSHKGLYDDYFKPSVEKYNEFELHCRISETQKYADSDYGTEGFRMEMKNKIQEILDFMYAHVADDEYFLYSDVDLVFLNKSTKYLKQYIDSGADIVFQDGAADIYNCGFMLIKKTSYTIELFKQTILNIENSTNIRTHDQKEINKIVDKSKVAIFDNRIYHYGLISPFQTWEDEVLNLPVDCIVFHACYTVGIENKIKMLNQIL
jgi:hypothetical protein